MEVNIRITKGGRMYLVVNIKTGPLLFGKSEITQSSDTFSSSGTLQLLNHWPRSAFLVNLISCIMLMLLTQTIGWF